MNKLYLRATHRTAGAIHLHKVWTDTQTRARLHESATPLHRAAPPHAHWRRNTATGALECRWVADAPAQPRPRLTGTRPNRLLRMQWRPRAAGMRPPSCRHAKG